MTRARHDQVFRLIKGMDEDKLQNNVILPILRDFEQGLSDECQTDEERFSYYLGNLCSIMRLAKAEDFVFDDGIYLHGAFHGHSLFGFRETKPQDKIWFAYPPDNDGLHSDDNYMTAKDAVLFSYLRSQSNYRNAKSKYGIYEKIPVSEILRDPEALRLTMETPSGQLILNFARLRGQIEARKKRRSVNLSSLMKKKE